MQNQVFNDALLKVAIKAARNAGDILLDGFNKVKNISYKSGIHNIVTEYDVLAENSIIAIIRESFQDHSFLAEESGESKTTALLEEGKVRWIIDPLDGTVNFAHGIPIFSVSIAAEVNNKIVAGVIYHPKLNELFSAVSGEGALLNGTKISVSNTQSLEESILVTGFPYTIQTHSEHTFQHFIGLVNKGIPIRRLGSAAIDLAYVACGRFDGFWEVGLSPWDVAAGWLLVKEAGGSVTQFNGSSYNVKSNSILATNSLIHKEFVEYLRT